MDKKWKKTERGNKALEKTIATTATNAVEDREDFIAAFSAAAPADRVPTLRAVRVVLMEKPVVTKAELTSLTITNRAAVDDPVDQGSDLVDARRAFQEVVVVADPLVGRVRPTATPVRAVTTTTTNRTRAKILIVNQEKDNQMIRPINQKTEN
jgi:hypothetical protein